MNKAVEGLLRPRQRISLRHTQVLRSRMLGRGGLGFDSAFEEFALPYKLDGLSKQLQI